MKNRDILRRSETKTGLRMGIGVGKVELDYGRGFPQVIPLPNGVALIDKEGFLTTSYNTIIITKTDVRTCRSKPNGKSTCEVVPLNPNKPHMLVR